MRVADGRIAPVRAWELVALASLLGVYLVTMALYGEAGTPAVNLFGAIALGVIMLLGAVPPAMREATVIWTPLFWFRIATAAYFSFGNAIVHFVNDESRRMMEAFFQNYESLMGKLNAVITLGALLTLASAWVLDAVWRRGAPRVDGPPRSRLEVGEPGRLLTVGLGFLAVGGTVKFIFTLPATLGVISFTLPGALGALALLADAGVYLLAVWAWRFQPRLLWLPVCLTGLNVALGLLAFSKTEVIASIMVLALGWLSKGLTWRRMLVTAGVITVTFALIVPFVAASRTEMVRRYQSLQGAGLAERLEIAGFYLQPTSGLDNPQQTGLIRFSYVNGSALALSLQDNGSPGGTLATLPAVFVPRALWPDKPDMTVIGREFNYLATGNEESASSPGCFAEAYWDYGWLGLPLLMIPLGLILQAWSLVSLWIIRGEQWLFFPFCLLGMKVGSSIDGFMVPTVFGTAVLALVAFVALRLALRLNSQILAAGLSGYRAR